jgi:hypothetical protein
MGKYDYLTKMKTKPKQTQIFGADSLTENVFSVNSACHNIASATAGVLCGLMKKENSVAKTN